MYDKLELYEYFNSKIKEVDEEYRTTTVNFNKYKNVTYVLSKIIELQEEEQNQVVLYLLNNKLFKIK